MQLKIHVEPEKTKIVGFSIDRDISNKTIRLHNELMITELLDKFGMVECKPATVPMQPHQKIEQTQLTTRPYNELIGTLLYFSTTCRPDITYETSYLSRFMETATDEHCKMAMQVLKYLKGTKNYDLVYCKDSSSLLGYSDSDFAGDLTDRNTTSGYGFTIGGSLVSWRSKKQCIVSQSTTEAEYISMS